MNNTLNQFARQELKSGLARLGESQQKMFLRMYSHNNPEAGINEVVDSLAEEKLDWAMQQVERSLAKAEKG